MDIREESLKKHYEWKGKISIKANVKADTAEALALAYTPGVAEPCLAIKEDISKSKMKDIKSTGYVVDTLEACIWLILNTENYKESPRMR
jgi:malic enzyme